MNPKPESPKKSKQSIEATWLALGIAVGVALGVALDNIAVGLALGIACGLSFGMVQAKKSEKCIKKHEDDGTQPKG
jgi:F0F1-type ATP synthase assembly protein I